MMQNDICEQDKHTGTIAYVHTGIYPSNSPSFTFVTYNAFGLAEVFSEVLLIVKKGDNQSINDILHSYFGAVCPANLKIIRISHIPKLNALFFLQVMLVITAYKNSLKAVISRNAAFLPYLVLIRKLFGLLVLLESHDFFTDLNLRDDKISRVKKRNNRLELRYIPQLSGLVCLQNAQRDLYHKYYQKLPIFVLRTGINTVHPSDIANRKFLAYIGSFDQHKGLEAIIKAASQSATKPDILLIGAKDAAEIQYYKSLAANFAYENKVTILNWMTKQDLYSMLPQVKAGVVPVMDTFFNRNITSPLKIFDYYSFGIPVLASDLPTTRELIEDGKTGLFFQSNDPVTFASQIDILYQSDRLYADMVQNVYLKADTLLWTKRAEQLKDSLAGIS